MDTLVNFRDLGGYLGANGRSVCHHRLLRSAQPVGLSQADKHKLTKQYKLARIVDFRGENEALQAPVDSINGTKYTLIDILASQDKKAASRKGLMHEATSDTIDRHMNELYKLIAADTKACRGYREFIDILLKGKDGATLFHCFAGKDRTGVAAAIVLHILGVSAEDIFTDYLLTNELRREANERECAKALAAGLSEDKVNTMKTALGVKREYLQSFLDGVAAQYGSFDKYITEALHLKDSERLELRELYLE